ncbi:DUF4255 domain-containing protein [Chitinophaga pendula]|uniref:DUF4255 domain-containing protein n=1 Tax=Chitinophaga TaxID=79328 RepID=UPI000BB00A75|nr:MULTISPECIES: DUF4255 domain-containing protein [Chitinophaga]ASZ12268.1 hypothetical protein CK934_15515 [Chitinophaga sp. MD30]UCJ10146.1 DUF4255 domain-containing protein [Chitinophaga pendula]
MIYETLSCITEEINNYFKRKLQINEDKVILSGIVNQDGSIAVQGENKIIATLINIERETVVQRPGTAAGRSFGTPVGPPASINLYVMFSAYFSSNNYAEALRFTSFIIAYFQSKPVFDTTNTPGLDTIIGKVIFEMESLAADKLNNVWTTLGAKYMPSVVYKVRMLTFNDAIIREFRPAVADIAADSSATSK